MKPHDHTFNSLSLSFLHIFEPRNQSEIQGMETHMNPKERSTQILAYRFNEESCPIFANFCRAVLHLPEGSFELFLTEKKPQTTKQTN